MNSDWIETEVRDFKGNKGVIVSDVNIGPSRYLGIKFKGQKQVHNFIFNNIGQDPLDPRGVMYRYDRKKRPKDWVSLSESNPFREPDWLKRLKRSKGK